MAIGINDSGTPGADTTTLTNNDDTFMGLGGNDTLRGLGGTDVLDGGEGNDSLEGGDGNDTLLGGAGDDRLIGGRDIDSLQGGLGNDVYYVDHLSDVVTELDGEGNDTVIATVAGYALTVANVEEVRFDLSGGSGADVLNGGFSHDTLRGNAGNDTLNGNAGNDTLDGGTGADLMQGGQGDDVYYVDDLNDVIVEAANEGNDAVITTVRSRAFDGLSIEMVRYNVRGTDNAETFVGGEWADTLQALAGDDLVEGLGGDDVLEGGKGRDTVLGGAGNDTLNVQMGDMGDQLEGGLGNDTYNLFEAGSIVMEAAGGGRDTISFGYSNQKSDVTDNIEVVALNNSAQRGQVLTLNDSDTGHDIYGREYDADVIYGNGGNDKIHGRRGASGLVDTLYGGMGSDTYSIDNATDILVELAGEGDADQIEGYYNKEGGSGALNIQLQDNIERLYILNAQRQVNANGTQQADLIHGFTTANVIDGQGGNDSLYGGRGQDELIGGSGDDTLNAGWYYQLSGGAKTDISFGNHPTALIEDDGSIDTLRGGTGDDRYMLFSNADTVVELAAEGTDTVVLHNVLQHTLADNIENLETAVASGPANLNGNSLGNRITAGAFNDTVSGLDGNDTLLGLDGRDELRGGEGHDSLDGGQGIDTLLGGNGNDVLNGSVIEYSPQHDSVLGTVSDGVLAGDRLEGGQGDDIYVIDSVRDIVVELANEGQDTVRSHVNLDLGTLANVESGELLGDRNLTIKGNAQGNQLVGNRGDNQLDGAGGADTLVGGAGNDTYLVDSLDDVVVELGAADSQDLVTGGADTVVTQLDGYTLGNNVENLRLIGTAITGQGNALDNVLTGNAQANVLRGDEGDDVLDGQAGADTLDGGNGNDTYHVDSAADQVIEATGGGRDAVVSSVSFSLQDLAAVEDLTLTKENTTGQGNAGGNWMSAINVDSNGFSFGLNNTALYGLAGDDTLVGGGTSSNKLYGGQGNDTYFVIGNTQSIVELAGEGTDTVWVSRFFGDYALADNVENAFVSADGRGFDVLSVIGNGLANQITGSFNRDSLQGGAGDDTLKGGLGNDTLNGGSGNDSMVGGLGDDTYVVDSLSDVVVERSREGTDTVISKLTGYSLGANVERLLFDLTGTAGNDLLLGGTLEDTLTGGAGADTLVGGKGNDTYVIDSQADVITELADEGIDTAQSSVSYTLGQGLENLTLTGSIALNGTGNSAANLLKGSSGNNRLDGQDGADTLDGGAGVDSLLGGAGNDTYVIDSLTDVITELANEGVDTVQSSLSYTLSGELENLTLIGTAALNGTGSAVANLIQGNSASNRLDGQGGADTLVGGAGNDTYVVDNAQDVVTEFINEGADTVEASASYSLGNHIENLTLTGSQAITGSGNGLANQINGNEASNTLEGNGGNDRLLGNGGGDR
ncbi:calcium-binding protein, partial [Aquabacterium sp.]|uniref:beta strand repeat-containing protein n=1 Tax=Aquabacterium sp. TaxID=1872578 RepID=UPI0024880F5F